jgi:hypothetical protein
LSDNAEKFLHIIRNEIKDVMPQQVPKWHSATVISADAGIDGGTAIVHLTTDPVGTNIIVQNSRELPLEVGDNVYVVAINGDLSNGYVDLRRTINSNYIYVDYNTGNNNNDGSSAHPFKSLQYAISRLPKNLNRRAFFIHFDSLDINEIVTIDDFYGGSIIISPKIDYTFSTIKKLNIENCMASISIDYVYTDQNFYIYETTNAHINHCSTTNSYPTVVGFLIMNSIGIVLNNCIVSNKATGIEATFSSMKISNCTLSSNGTGIVASTNSNIFSQNNSGANNYYGIYAYYNSTVGKNGTQPTGSTANGYADLSSIIRG